MPDTQSTIDVSVTLMRCLSEAEADRIVAQALDRACPWPGMTRRGLRVLVKPNLLLASQLACTSAAVVAAACRWVLDQGATPVVADSPGFGSVRGVARAVGMDEALSPLGLRVHPMAAGRPVLLASGDTVTISTTALEADAVLSVARVKAHRQMVLSLSVKNLYGCVPGLRKAVYHTKQGCDPDHFAAMQAAILAALPPCAGLVDGITAMHETGPSSGRPYALGLLGASASPVALDESLCLALGCDPCDVLLQRAFIRAGHPHTRAHGACVTCTDLAPEDVDAAGFILPRCLMHTSFRPMRLLRSCIKRVWYEVLH